MNRLVFGLAIVALLVCSGAALADGQGGPVYTIHPVEIRGHRDIPAVIEVVRSQPKLPLHALQPAFAAQVEAGIQHGPF
jgi:hypothetical protein